MMRLAANLSLMFTEVPLLERFQAAKNAGFEVVEIQFPYVESIADLVAAKSAAGVEVCLINVPADDLMVGGEGLAAVPEKQAQFVQALSLCAEYANALQVKMVNVLPGRCLDNARKAQYRDTLISNLSKAATFFAEHDILVTFEAVNTRDMPNFIIHNTQQMLDVMNEVAHDNLKMQFDVYHMQIMDGQVSNSIQQYGHLIGHIQFADLPGRGEPFTGELSFANIFANIRDSAYHGYVAAEYKPTVVTQNSLGWMKQLDIAWLAGTARVK
ncbi:TIM barrel protein [Colwellia ponticola]|uniref:TIM barrel protein n=2 Tax=Colwellia ponticola TaxID=2304625 RepID=A0A8H2JNM7_9GAMM|nr:TIM barrel protein [Colwellia ponticola]